MTTVKKQRAVDAGSFVDEILNEILSAPDKDTLEDDAELTDMTGEAADEFVRRAVSASMTRMGRERFAQAEGALRESKRRPPINVVPSEAARVKRGYVESLQSAASQLSVAARGAKQVSKRDLDSALEDLTELRSMKKRPKKK